MVRKIRAKLVLQLRAEGLSGRAIAVSQQMSRWAAGWNPDRLIFMFQAALLVSYQSCSASFGVRY